MALTIARYEGAAALERLTRRGAQPEPALPQSIIDRNAEIFGRPMTAHEVVAQVLREVREEGDEAVRRYTKLFDNREIEALEVPRADWERALQTIDPELREALELAADRIRRFHERQVRQSWIEPEELGIFGQIIRPLQRVGIYTPGGSAAPPLLAPHDRHPGARRRRGGDHHRGTSAR